MFTRAQTLKAVYTHLIVVFLNSNQSHSVSHMQPSSISVTIVEDHQATLTGLKLGLAEEGVDIVGTSTTSDDGLRLAEQLKPKVVVLDLHVPGSLAPKAMLKAFCELPDSKVVVFSADHRPGLVRLVLSMGACAYLVKSEEVSTLAKAIRDVANGKSGISSQALPDLHKKLTRSEMEILGLLGRGFKYQEIADYRQTSSATARKQCENLILKLGLETREQLIAWSVQNGYGTDDLW